MKSNGQHSEGAESDPRSPVGGRPRVSGPLDATIDLSPTTSPTASPTPANTSSGKAMCFRDNSECPVASGTHALLRSRLRMASMVLFGGFAVFVIWRLTFNPFDTALQTVITLAHLGVTAMLGIQAGLLFRSDCHSMKTLRAHELALFGAPALYFLLMGYQEIGMHAREHSIIPHTTPPWLVLIFVYALFIPTTWKRAAGVVGGLCAAPTLLVIVLVFVDADVRNTDGAVGEVTKMVMFMSLIAVTGTTGVYTITNLRQEAFEAQALGQYRLRKKIGSGGMGDVFLAEHALMKRPCAVKLIHPDKANDPKMLARFEREVRVIAKLSHWHSIDIYDYGRTDDGALYYVMEFLPGMDLRQLVQRYGPLHPERIVHFLSQTCEALAEAHAYGLVHRDIKPANIFAAQRGGQFDVTKLLDFGLAKSEIELDAEVTQQGAITGSPLYISPEQVTGDHAPDARTDIYALGAVGYFLASGHPPFEYSQGMRAMIAHVNEPPKPPTDYRPELPLDLEAVLMRCLAKHADDRYQTAEELRDALLHCEDAGNWTDQNAQEWWREQEQGAMAAV